MTVSPSVRINVSGARGETFADVVRRTGQYGVLPTDTDAQALSKLNAAAEAAAAAAEAFSGPTYASTAAGIAATTNGQSFAVAAAGIVTVYKNVSGVATYQRDMATTAALAASTGGALVGVIQTGTGATTRTAQAALRDIVDPRAYGAVMDGVANDRTAMVNADAVGAVRISKPVLISTSMTFTNPVEIVGNGQIIVPSGQTVTLLAGVIAHKRLIFGGLGAIAGLSEAWLEWFAGDVKTTGSTVPTTDATARLQVAMDSVSGGGILYAGPGNWRVSGTAVTMHQGQSFWGAGYGSKGGTVFYWSGTTRALFLKSDLGAGTRGARIGNFRAQPITGSVPAVSSFAIDLNQSDMMVQNIVLQGAYTGVRFNLSYKSRALNVTCIESAYSGFTVKDSIDVFIDQWNVSGDDILITTAAPTGGAFTVGSTVTHPGSTGTITEVYSTTIYRVAWLGPPPAAAATITATGKSATLSSQVACHLGGQIRFEGTSESCVISKGDGIGGEYGLYVNGTGAAGRVAGNSGYNVIEAGAYFDSSYSGSFMSGAYGFELDGWFATTRKQDKRGLELAYCRQIAGTPRCENNAGSGIFWDATSKHVYLTPRNVGNGRFYTLTNTADVTISGAATNWSLIGGFAGHPNLAGVSAPKALYIDAATSGNFSVIALNVPNGSVINTSTGDSQAWFGVTGMPMRVDISSIPNAANDAAAAAAGVPKGGAYRNGSVGMWRVT